VAPMGSDGNVMWADYHPDRVWANELPTSQKDVERRTLDRKVFGPAWERPALFRQLFAVWEDLADRMCLPDGARCWRWCAWPRVPHESGAEAVRPPRYGDPVRKVRRGKDVKAQLEREASRW